MTKKPLALIGVAVVSLSFASEAAAAGRESILRELANPFASSRYSRYTVNPFGLPQLSTGSPFQIAQSTSTATETTPTPLVTEIDETPDLTPLASTSTRPPFRPRVRSPFRPPPRPGL